MSISVVISYKDAHVFTPSEVLRERATKRKIAVEPELLKELKEFLCPGESIEDFMLSAVRCEVFRRLRQREGAAPCEPEDMPARGD